MRDTGALNIPKQGWVRLIRKAIGMTIKQLASQLQVDPSRVVKIESSEPEGAITLKTLESVAEKMNCKLVYTFLPNTSLEQMIEQKGKHPNNRLRMVTIKPTNKCYGHLHYNDIILLMDVLYRLRQSLVDNKMGLNDENHPVY